MSVSLLSETQTQKLDISYREILTNKRSSFGLIALGIAILQWSFFDPVLTERFLSIGLTEELAGFAYLGLAIAYFISCSINSTLEDYLSNKFVLQLGIISLGFSCLLIGTNLFLPFEIIWPVFFGLALTGFF